MASSLMIQSHVPTTFTACNCASVGAVDDATLPCRLGKTGECPRCTCGKSSSTLLSQMHAVEHNDLSILPAMDT